MFTVLCRTRFVRSCRALKSSRTSRYFSHPTFALLSLAPSLSCSRPGVASPGLLPPPRYIRCYASVFAAGRVFSFSSLAYACRIVWDTRYMMRRRFLRSLLFFKRWRTSIVTSALSIYNNRFRIPIYFEVYILMGIWGV